MKLHEELYFEITAEGAKNTINNFVNFITSGELDDFFEFSSDFIVYNDNYPTANDTSKVSITLANDDFGIEIDEFDPEKFLDVLCSGGSSLLIHGHLYDIDDEEYRFISHPGDSCYINAENIEYSDELDEEAQKENRDNDYYDEY
jgi:hypothetical protein